MQQATYSNVKISVCARIRPIISQDFQRANVVKREPEVCVHCHKDGQSIKLLQDSFHHKNYRLDHTLDASTTQVDVYNTALKGIVFDVLKGYNGTALVYGPTASGIFLSHLLSLHLLIKWQAKPTQCSVMSLK